MGKPRKEVALIDMMITILDRVKNTLELIKEDKMSVKEACRRNDISYTAVRRILFATNWEALEDETEYENFKKKFSETVPLYHWTEILFCDVFGLPRNPESIAKMPPDVRETVEKAVHSLTECEEKVIRLFYEDNMTKEEVAAEIGRSYERVRQIKAKAMRKLKHPSRMGYIVFGDGYYCSKRKAYDDVYNDTVLKAIKDEENKLRIAVENRKKQIQGIDSMIPPREFFGTDEISELNLSVRSFNCLWRAGIHTIEDLRNTTYDELCRVRNLGKKGLDEILDIMERNCIELNSVKLEKE